MDGDLKVVKLSASDVDLIVTALETLATVGNAKAYILPGLLTFEPLIVRLREGEYVKSN